MKHDFSIVTAETINKIVSSKPHDIYQMVKTAYIRHGGGEAQNPPSYFLTFPDKPKSRIIALPASIQNNPRIAGIKWISSNPDNIERGMKRASAVIILNDYNTGYPIACMEGGIISALRTVYSAAIAGEYLSDVKQNKKTIGIVGAGNISHNFIRCIKEEKWQISNIVLYDINYDTSLKFKSEIAELMPDLDITVTTQIDQLLLRSELVFLSTTSTIPYISDISLFKHNPLILNISLRDLAPEILLSSNNVVDDIDHVLNASTSPHLAYQKCGNKDFINCTMHELINGYKFFNTLKPTVFSPMGMGVLDLVVAHYIYQESVKQNVDIKINNFFEC